MTVVACVMATVLVAADVACVESGHDWREVDAVLQVVRNRSEYSGQNLFAILTARRQFAHGCPRKRMHWRHMWGGLRMITDHLDVPLWLRDARVRWFCAKSAAWKWYERDSVAWSGRLQVVGSLRHLYWRLRG